MYNYILTDDNLRSPSTSKTGKGNIPRDHFYQDRRSMEWSFPKGYQIFKRISDIPYPRRCHLLSPLEDGAFQINRFLISLDAYQESANKAIPPSEILRRCCLEGPKYAEILKDLRALNWKIHLHATKSRTGELFKGDYLRVYDIGDIFNYNYLIHWETPKDEVDDYTYGDIPVDISPEVLEEFRSMAQEVVEPLRIKEVKSEEILLRITSSKSLDSKSLKTDYNWRLKERENGMSSRIGLVKRCIIDVGPANVRDTILLSPGSLNRVNWIDQQTAQLVEQLDESAQTRNKDLKDRRIKKVFAPLSYFYMRDIKKEGITKPRELLKVMLEVLRDRFPEAKAYEYPDFFSDYRVLLQDGTIIAPKRGHGLGMANSLTTLMQVIIHRMILRRINFIDGAENVKCCVLNDDHVASFTQSDCLDDYECEDFNILKDLSIIQNLDKSMISRNGFVFCEEYHDYYSSIINLKESYRRRSSLLPLLCHNIVEAKRLTASVCTEENLQYLGVYKEEFVSKFGYEFFPEEVNYPLRFGGWFTRCVAGVRLDLYDLSEQPFSKCVQKAYEACRINSLSYDIPVKHRRYHNPLTQVFPGLDNPDLLEMLGSDDYRTIYNRMIRPKSFPLIESRAWEKLRIRRRRRFEQSASPFLCFRDFMSYVWKDIRDEVYLIPKELTIKIIPLMDNAVEMEDLYSSPNPILSSVATDRRYRYVSDLAEHYSIHSGSKDTPKKASNDIFRCQKLLSISGPETILTGVFHDWYYDYFSDSDEAEANSFYHCPMRVAKAYSHVSGVIGIPIGLSPPDDTILNFKKEVYGRLLLQEEIKFLCDRKIYDRRIIKMFVVINDYYPNLFKNFDDVVNFIVEAPERIRREEEYLPPFEFNEMQNKEILDFQFGTFKASWIQILPLCKPNKYHDLTDERLVRIFNEATASVPIEEVKGIDEMIDRSFDYVITNCVSCALQGEEEAMFRDDLIPLKSRIRDIYLGLPADEKYFESWQFRRIRFFGLKHEESDTKEINQVVSVESTW